MRYCHLFSLSDAGHMCQKFLCRLTLLSAINEINVAINRNVLFKIFRFMKHMTCFSRVVIQWHCSIICCSASGDCEKIEVLSMCC